MKKLLGFTLSLLMALSIITASASDTKAITAKATLTNNKWYINRTAKSGNKAYYKIVMKKAGGIILGVNNSYNYATLKYKIYNSKGKNLFSRELSMEDSTKVTHTIGLAKGTYYVYVNASYVSTSGSGYAFSYKVTNTATIKKNTKKKKAKKLKKKGTITGVVPVGSKKKYYYKMTLKKNQKVNLDIAIRASHGGGNGGLSIKITPPKRVILTGGYMSNFGNKNITWKSSGKLPKGTYTIIVTQYSTGNGYYSIKWK